VNLSSFQKPSRYIGGEYNAAGRDRGASENFSRKDFRKSPVVHCTLAFPDTYEVGMSHLGLRVLYEIINSLPYASAQRVFSPWTDLEEYLRREGRPLTSLESGTPLREFDVLGFSLQYELSYTTVLNMLSLSGIPLRAEERKDEKGHLPLVVAGGPCTVNPAPMASFIDAFLIGDGEEAVVELMDTVRQWKTSGDGRRDSLLQGVARLKGFYVPSLHRRGECVQRRIVYDLDAAPYPMKPLVPYTSIVHDRVTIEVSRGCTMGCRFCQAGMIYRPLRERSPGRVLEIAEQSLRNTGYEEVSFTSLSAGDYSHLLPLTKEFNRRYSASRIALSLPSLRVAAVDRAVLREIRTVRKTGFTMAPEAATQRLRDVINKDFSDDDYEKALSALFEEGWLTLKMYFMIGLPTEREEDIEAIREMALRALRIAKKNTGRFVNIGITVSPFIPKAHTPFQWCGQAGFEEMQGKLSYLREALSSKKLKYKGHNGEMSLLEAVFARGDEKLSLVIEEAWKQGCRLDGWSELFDFGKWSAAMDKTGIDGPAYAQRTFGKDESLPWDMVDAGVTKEFLRREYERALSEERSGDCRKACTACGLACTSAEEKHEEITFSALQPPGASVTPGIGKVRVRVRFSKTGTLRYLSHLELVTAMHRGLRRAGVPFDFSKGFHPSPKVSFCPPLSVGVAGKREFFDMEVFTPFDIEFYLGELRKTMPEGINIDTMAVIPVNEPSLSGFIKKYAYEVRESAESTATAGGLSCGSWTAGAPLIVKRDSGDVDISPCIESVEQREDVFVLTLADREDIRVRIGEIAGSLFGRNSGELDIMRTAVYGLKNGWVEPL